MDETSYPQTSTHTANVTHAFTALALQLKCQGVNRARNREEARSTIRKTIESLSPQLAAARAFIGDDCRLVLLPEHWLAGFPVHESFTEWVDKACLAMDDPLYEALGAIAREQNIFLAGDAYELDPNFPRLYFQTCFAFDPSGEMVLRYRRINSTLTPTPHDVWDAYLEQYGIEGVFPVAETEIGNLAILPADEILFPEVARCLTLRGAEILLHPTSEVSGDAPLEAAKIARAVENTVYLVSSNTAGIANTPIPEASVDGGSKIVDYRGLVVAQTGSGESMAAYGEIDLAALRRYRRRPGPKNLLSRQRLEVYAQLYRQSSIYPANTMLEGNIERNHFRQHQQVAMERMRNLGIL